MKDSKKNRFFSSRLAVPLVLIPALAAAIVLAPYIWAFGNIKTTLIILLHVAAPLTLLAIWTYSLRQKVVRQTRELEESEAKYRTLVENAHDGITLILGNEHIYANKSLLNMLGYSEEEYKALKPNDLIPSMPDNSQLFEHHQHMRQGGHAMKDRFECRLKTKDGMLLSALISASPIVIEGQHGAIIMITDITERKKLEEEQLKIHKLEALGILAGGIAHDFNNILAAILGSVSIARRTASKSGSFEQIESLLDSAQKATLRAKDLISQLLTFSKGGEPIRQSASVEDLIMESAELGLRGSNVKSELAIAGDIQPVEVDPGQIIQVFSNLVINADQAMPEGGTVYIRAENIKNGSQVLHLLEDKQYVRITICDRGIGIGEEDLPRIFDPYFTTKKDGAGLGLATSFSIVKKHGGQIEVDSKPEIGTTFQVYLPAAKHKNAVQQIEPEDKFEDTGRVLIMDDDHDVLEMARMMVSHLGYDVETARDGIEVIERYRHSIEINAPFDVVLMDLTVPGGMGGKEAIEQLRKIDPEVTAIVSSGYSDDPVMSEFTACGFKGVVSKPYTIEELEIAIGRSRTQTTLS
ncbi:MAG: PAS domain S-box protein [Proteobacteria bacterium]|nr:PAS domain S-box protein [Pseudomonadota bacterium]